MYEWFGKRLRWYRESQIRRRAQYWVERMDAGDLKPTERQDFDVWLRADPRHEPIFSAMWTIQGWLIAEAADYARNGTSEKSPTLPFRVVTATLAAAAIMAVIMVAGLQWFRAASTEYSTRTGELRTVRLADGSNVDLNTRTTLRWDPCEMRCVTLLEGEAHFEVVKEPGRPFVVKIGSLASIRVTGTAFSIHHTETDTSVNVSSGSVQITGYAPSRAHALWVRTLSANEQLVFGPDRIKLDVSAATPNLDSWRRRILEIDDTVPVVVRELSRYTDVPISFDPRLADDRIAAKLDLADIPRTLMSLPAHAPISVERVGHGYMLRPRPFQRLSTDRH